MYGNSIVRKKINAIGEGKIIYESNVFVSVKGTGVNVYLEVL